MSQTVEFDSDFLSLDLNNLPEAPPIEVPPSGIYDLTVTVSPKIVNSQKTGKTYKLIEFKYVIVDTIELLDKNADPPLKGQLFSVATSIEPERIKWHSANLKALAEICGARNMEELFKAPAIRVIAKVIRKENKENPGEYFATVSNIQAA